MKNSIKILFLLSLLTSVAFAKNYTIFLSFDNSSVKYLEEIKKETRQLFSSSDSISYKINVCKENCLESSSNIFILNQSKKYKREYKKYILTYNNISSLNEKNILLRSSALAIYEFLKEKKTKSIYIKNSQVKKTEVKQLSFNSKNRLSLEDAILKLQKDNLQIKQNNNDVLLSQLNIKEANSYYKPNISLSSNYIQIDSDRARYSNGVNSQGTLDFGVKLSQLVYSNKVLENIKISKLLNNSSKQETKALNDELKYKTVVLYLNLLKAKKYIDVVTLKHQFISENLEFAKQRVDIGVKDKSDLYRWQTETSNANIELSDANKQYENILVELKNLLQENSDFSLENYDMSASLFKLLNKDAIEYFKDEELSKTFYKNSINTHPRVLQLEQLIFAKQKEQKINKNSRYIPTIALEASAKRILKRYGEAKDALRPWDDKEYQAVLNLNLPIYEGGLKSKQIEANQIEVLNLKLKQVDIKNSLYENMKKNIDSLRYSHNKIEFSKISQSTAKKNFELVQDKYKNSKENIITLLDAQNRYFISKLEFDVSVLDYFIDLSSIYFFSGNIDVLSNQKKKEEFEKSLEDFKNE